MVYVKSSTKRYGKKRATTQAKAVVKATKMLMLRSVETKYHITNISVAALNHDTIYSFCPTQTIPVGATATTRVGDKILLKSFEWNGTFNVLSTILNAKVRVLVGWSRDQSAATTLTTAGLASNDIFYPSGGLQAQQIVNPSLFQVLSDNVYDINSNTTTSLDCKSWYTYQNLKLMNFKYAGQGSDVGQNKNLWCVIIPFNITGAAGGAFAIQSSACLKFKDP